MSFLVSLVSEIDRLKMANFRKNAPVALHHGRVGKPRPSVSVSHNNLRENTDMERL
jgi:hypothetical protein